MTCSLLSDENLNQIQKFISENPEMSIVEYHSILPTETDNDGFFFAEMTKTR